MTDISFGLWWARKKGSPLNSEIINVTDVGDIEFLFHAMANRSLTAALSEWEFIAPVLPPEQPDVFDAGDIQIEPVRRDPGGQHVGTSPPGVTVTHKPTGIRVFVDTERSNHRNIAIAKDAILGALTSPHFRG